MATGRKKKKGTVFGAVRFFKGSSCTASDESASSASPSDATSVSIQMTSLETLSAGTSSMTSRSSCSAADDNNWFWAVHNNNLSAVNGLLSRGADVNAVASTDGWSALHIASWNGWVDLVQLLIASGCDLDIVGPGEVTPLALASQRGHTIVVRALVYAGCDVNRRAELRMTTKPSKSKTGARPRGDDVGVRFRNVTALHLAARYGHMGVLRCLLSAGAPVDATMTVADRIGGLTPLHLAVEAGNIDVIDYLIAAGSDVNTSTRAAADDTSVSCSSSATRAKSELLRR